MDAGADHCPRVPPAASGHSVPEFRGESIVTGVQVRGVPSVEKGETQGSSSKLPERNLLEVRSTSVGAFEVGTAEKRRRVGFRSTEMRA